jgi:hypothetical protein
MDRADARGAITRGSENFGSFVNLINPDGYYENLVLSKDETLIIRDYDGDPERELRGWGPDPGPIPITVIRQMAVDEEAVLQLRFDADHWDSLIYFRAGIPVELGGRLELTLADGVDVATQVGRTIEVFDWTGVEPTGAFGVASAYLWDLSNLYSTGVVRLTGTGGVADYDQSGLIDQADLDFVLLNWGADATTPPASWINDLPSGQVDQDELNKVLLNWGSSAAASAAANAAVPEPTGTILGLLALTVVLMYSRRLALRR